MERIKIAVCGDDRHCLQIMENKIVQNVNRKYKNKIQVDQYDRHVDLNLIAQQYDVICFNDHFIKAFAMTDRKEVVLSLKRKIKTYYVDDIYYVEADMKNTHIWLEQSEVIEPLSFHEIKSLLEGENFIQIHRSYLVNCKHIKSIDNCLAYMKNGACLPISKYRKTDVYQQWKSYLQTFGSNG